MKNTILINDDLGQIFQMACDKRLEQAANSRYVNITDADIYDAYHAARRNHLRYNRTKNTLCDDRLGVLSRPSDPKEWEVTTYSEALEYLAHEVWCNAVRDFNVKQMQ